MRRGPCLLAALAGCCADPRSNIRRLYAAGSPDRSEIFLRLRAIAVPHLGSRRWSAPAHAQSSMSVFFHRNIAHLRCCPLALLLVLDR